VARRALSRRPDATLYAEIRKSTIEPDNNRPGNNVNNGGVAGHSGHRQLQADDNHGIANSLQDITLIENNIYKDSANCRNSPRNSYLTPGSCWTKRNGIE